MDIDKALRMAVETGKVEFGTRSCTKAAAGKAKLLLISSNCPAASRKKLEALCAKAGVKVQAYKGTSMELGAVCGKPFPVSVLAVVEAGTSNILDMGKFEVAAERSTGGETEKERKAHAAEQVQEAQG